jgi:hypothetical protein
VAFDIDRLRSERVYSTRAPARGVKEDLERLRRIDAEMGEKKQAWSRRSLACTGLAVASFFGLFLPIIEAVGFLLLVMALGAGAVGMVVCFVLSLRYKGLDLEDRRYELVARLLHRLRKDIPPDEPVTVELDFRPVDDERHLTGKGKVRDWDTRSFAQRWLSLQVRLTDGTHLRIGMEERLVLLRRTRRNPRGKLKVKNKQKGAALLHVQLRVKPERHPHLARLGARARAAVRLPERTSLRRLEVAEDGLGLRARMPRDWVARDDVKSPSRDAPRTAVMALLSLYQVLNYSTTLRKQEKAKAS